MPTRGGGAGSRRRPVFRVEPLERRATYGFSPPWALFLPEIGQDCCKRQMITPVSTGARTPDVLRRPHRPPGPHHAATARRGEQGGPGRPGVLRRDDRGVRPPQTPRAPGEGPGQRGHLRADQRGAAPPGGGPARALAAPAPPDRLRLRTLPSGQGGSGHTRNTGRTEGRGKSI